MAMGFLAFGLLSFPSQAQRSSANRPLCASLDAKELNIWTDQLQVHPGQFLQAALKPLHQALNEDLFKLNKEARQQLLTHFRQYFHLAPWMNQLPSSLQNSTTAQSYTQLWLFKKYLGTVRKSAFRAEVIEFSLRGRGLPEERRSRVLDFPAAPQLAAVRPYSCQSASDRAMYDCSRSLYLIEAYLGADLLCSAQHDPNVIHFKYLVAASNRGLQIVDVHRGQTSLFKQSLMDLQKLGQSARRPELLRWLSHVTFTPESQLSDWGLTQD